MSNSYKSHRKISKVRKNDRRLGHDTLGLINSPVHKRAYRAGGISPSSKLYKMVKGGKPSLHSKKLKTCKSIRTFYNLKKKQVKKLRKDLSGSKGNASIMLQRKMESMLKNVVYRSGWVRTMFHAQQLITHRHILVNGEIINVPMKALKAGDEISLKESTRTNVHINKTATEVAIGQVPYITHKSDFVKVFERPPANAEEVAYTHPSINSFPILVEFRG